MSIYTEKGYRNRECYLSKLAIEMGIDFELVASLADSLGETEDFDGLISVLEDYNNGI